MLNLFETTERCCAYSNLPLAVQSCIPKSQYKLVCNNVVFVAFPFSCRLLFVADLARDQILVCGLDGSRLKVFLTGSVVRSVRALFVDDASATLYWGDTQADSISAAGIDGSWTKVPGQSDLHQ